MSQLFNALKGSLFALVVICILFLRNQLKKTQSQKKRFVVVATDFLVLVVADSCTYLPVFYHMISECNDFYSSGEEDKDMYLPYWKLQSISNSTSTPTVQPGKTPWEYQTGTELKTFPYWGYKATYDAGGK